MNATPSLPDASDRASGGSGADAPAGAASAGVHLLHRETTEAIIGAAFEVQKTLGYGFLEKVYENALVEELSRRGLRARPQVQIEVHYKGVCVGHYVADIPVEEKVLVELKAEKEYNPKHEAQMLNYLTATRIRVGLILNFGERKCHPKRLIR